MLSYDIHTRERMGLDLPWANNMGGSQLHSQGGRHPPFHLCHYRKLSFFPLLPVFLIPLVFPVFGIPPGLFMGLCGFLFIFYVHFYGHFLPPLSLCSIPAMALMGELVGSY